MACKTSKPCAVVASSTEKHPDEIVKLILDVDDLPVSTDIEDGIKAYPWHIDTKYYTADVNLCSVEKKTLGSVDFAVSVEAIVINFDNNRSDGLQVVESWLSFLKEFEPEVQILLCDRCSDNPTSGVSRTEVQEWCVEQGFELVELNPELDAEWEAEQDFIETTGIKRVVQAMHAHVWPNLHMKGKSPQLALTVQSMLNGSSLGDSYDSSVTSLGQNLQDVHLNPLPQIIDAPNNYITEMEERIEEMLGDGGGVASFSSLFEQLYNMKQRVQNLPNDQRRACAEQVVMAFWKAIGGDDDELGDLSDAGDT